MTKNYNFSDFSSLLGNSYKVFGNQEVLFSNAKTISDADEQSIIWIGNKIENKEDLVLNTKASVIICDNSFLSQKYAGNKCLVLVENPRLVFLRIVEKLFVEKPTFGIHPTAYVHPEAIIHQNTFVGAFTYIGKSQIDEGTYIYGNCYLYDNITIGKNVIIHAGTVIGADGFGYQKNEFGELEKFPHIGGVVIEDNVEIGANTCIDKGTLGNTHIKKGAKIDNLVHIAHNVVIGENSAVIALSLVGGSTEIGNNAWIAPCVTIRDGIKIGQNATLGMGAVVTKSIPDNEVWAGSPAKPIEELKKQLKKIENL
jgi:UDP-3-O-[3-hydroxymyristoyl] glucosamine N-acyltransferase